MNVTRRESTLTVAFKQSGMEIRGIRHGKDELELQVDLFPLSFYMSLDHAVKEGRSAYPCINLPFGKFQRFTLERQGGLKNGEMWFDLKTTSPGVFFHIELRQQEIQNLLKDMRTYMTR